MNSPSHNHVIHVCSTRSSIQLLEGAWTWWWMDEVDMASNGRTDKHVISTSEPQTTMASTMCKVELLLDGWNRLSCKLIRDNESLSIIIMGKTSSQGCKELQMIQDEYMLSRRFCFSSISLSLSFFSVPSLSFFASTTSSCPQKSKMELLRKCENRSPKNGHWPWGQRKKIPFRVWEQEK